MGLNGHTTYCCSTPSGVATLHYFVSPDGIRGYSIQSRCGLRLILVTVQKLCYIHQNPVRAGLVARPEDWLYSSAGNYLHGKGWLEMPLLWPDFATDGGWFFGNTDFPLLQWSRSGAWTVIGV